MAQKTNYGELSADELIFQKTVTWKIPNVFALPKCPDYMVKSPEFSFANATWVLSMYPYGQTICESESYIDFMMHRTQSHVPEHEVFCYFFLKTRKNREFRPTSNSRVFSPKYYRNFLAESFMEHSDLAEKQKSIAPKGTLTFVCRIRSENTAEVPPHLLRSAESEITLQTPVSKKLPAPNSKLLLDLEELFLSGDGSDVTLKIKGQKLEAHRAILRARSPVFASMLKHNMKEKNTGLINIQDCDPKMFSDFLRFLYCGSVEVITSQNMCSLYRTSDKYDVQDLKSECLAYMKGHISVENFCDVITLALQHNEADLVKQSTIFFTRNLPKIILTVKWQIFLTENPIQSNELLIKALATDKSART